MPCPAILAGGLPNSCCVNLGRPMPVPAGTSSLPLLAEASGDAMGAGHRSPRLHAKGRPAGFSFESRERKWLRTFGTSFLPLLTVAETGSVKCWDSVAASKVANGSVSASILKKASSRAACRTAEVDRAAEQNLWWKITSET